MCRHALDDQGRCGHPDVHPHLCISWHFTDQGIRSVKDTVKRADVVQEAAGKFGAKMTQIFWTQGAYDVVAIIDAPNDESATAFALAIGVAGNIRTQTLRAFSRDEMSGILAKLG